MTKQYGVKYPGPGGVISSAPKANALAVVERAQKLPCTKGALMMERELQFSDWVGLKND